MDGSTVSTMRSDRFGAGARIAASVAMMRVMVLLAMVAGGPAKAEPLREEQTSLATVAIEVVAQGLDTPWSLAPLPEGGFLVTERGGALRHVAADGRVSGPLAGVPRVAAFGQGGLLDVVLAPDFPDSRWVYLSYVEPTAGGVRTAVARGWVDESYGALTRVERLFGQNRDPQGRHHFGSRLVFDRDGRLFVTTGERFFLRDEAQALDSHLGKVLRIAADGSLPPDNPRFDDAQAVPELYSYGHRNIQGAALDPRTGALWIHEHGPQGGDELNLVRPGGNHGWPVITYGREYVTGFRIGEGTERADVVPPVVQWTPSIAPSGMTFYRGSFEPWANSLFVGALKHRMLLRLQLDGDQVVGQERMLESLGARIRDVRMAPDGLLHVVDESGGRILRLRPR